MNSEGWLSVFTVREFVQLVGDTVWLRVKRTLGLSSEIPFTFRLKDEGIHYQKLGFHSRRFGRLIEISNIKPFFGSKALVRPLTSDRLVLDQVFIVQEYKPLVELVLEFQSNKQPILILDAGANAGYTSLYFNHYFPQARIIAIEPDPGNFDVLLKMIAINKLTAAILPMQRALWTNSAELLSLDSSFRDGMEWSRRTTIDNSVNSGVKVKTITLGQLMEENQDESIKILKMDIEGTEVKLFNDESFKACLRRNVSYVALEIHEECEGADIIPLVLENLGFQCRRKLETIFCVNRSLINHGAH